jgi:hypothetical protein
LAHVNGMLNYGYALVVFKPNKIPLNLVVFYLICINPWLCCSVTGRFIAIPIGI